MIRQSYIGVLFRVRVHGLEFRIWLSFVRCTWRAQYPLLRNTPDFLKGSFYYRSIPELRGIGISGLVDSTRLRAWSRVLAAKIEGQDLGSTTTRCEVSLCEAARCEVSMWRSLVWSLCEATQCESLLYEANQCEIAIHESYIEAVTPGPKQTARK